MRKTLTAKTLARKLATRIDVDALRTVVRLFNTDIVTFDKMEVTLFTGGFLTPTTCRRMNEVSEVFDLGYRVSRAGGKLAAYYLDGIKAVSQWSPDSRTIKISRAA